MERNSGHEMGVSLEKYQSDLSSGKWKGGWLENLNGSELGDVLQVSVGNFVIHPISVILEEIWWENMRVMCSSHQMENWLGSH